jgi:hypothetical protein
MKFLEAFGLAQEASGGPFCIRRNKWSAGAYFTLNLEGLYPSDLKDNVIQWLYPSDMNADDWSVLWNFTPDRESKE